MNEKKVEATDEQTLYQKGVEAATRYLEFHGYEVLEKDWECRFGTVSVIARDSDDAFCFIQVSVRDGLEEGMPDVEEVRESRETAERIALMYLVTSDDWTDNTEVRFDNISILVDGPHKALLRHHRGCFAAA